jgi:adenylate kinase family enzyme
VQYNLVHISVGDLLREQVQQGTPAGAASADSQHFLSTASTAA